MDAEGFLLEIDGLTKDFRGLRAVDSHCLRIGAEEILGVIGPNGAGKTTLFNLITGLIPPTRGSIRFLGQSITRLRPDAIARLGIARTFQNIRLFNAMSALDNVRVAQQLRAPLNPFAVMASAPPFLRRERELAGAAMELLRIFGLQRFGDQPAGSLPYGDQRRLEIARALATGPRLLLLDEPTVGMNPRESQDLLELIIRVRAMYRLSIMLVAHDLRLVMGLCHRIQVMNNGRTIAEGTPAVIRSNPQVIEAYLGRTRTGA
jgi:branched-chain amino acid transport system ATP-binding protein